MISKHEKLTPNSVFIYWHLRVIPAKQQKNGIWEAKGKRFKKGDRLGVANDMINETEDGLMWS